MGIRGFFTRERLLKAVHLTLDLIIPFTLGFLMAGIPVQNQCEKQCNEFIRENYANETGIYELPFNQTLIINSNATYITEKVVKIEEVVYNEKMRDNPGK